MRNRVLPMAFGGLCLAAATLTCTGAELQTALPLDINNAQDFAQQSAAVRAGLQPGGPYGWLNARERYLVAQDLDAMAALIQRRGDFSGMTPAERVRLFDAQEDANRWLTGIDSGWWTCEQAPQTGSHLPRTLCWPREGI